MKTVDAHEAKEHFPRILAEVENGEVYIINRNGKPVAEIRPMKHRKRTSTDPELSRIGLNYDPAESLSDDEAGDVT